MSAVQKYVAWGAKLSPDGLYRYRLWREWRGTHDPKNWEWWTGKDAFDGAGKRIGFPKPCVFVMLNPSTADAEHDDATIRRCVGFAKAWNYERLEVVNLFAYRASKPVDLWRAERQGVDIIGPNNLEAVRDATINAGMVVCAWGASEEVTPYHADTVRGWCSPQAKLFTLGLTRTRQPRHPLYVKSDTSPEPYE